MMAATCEACGRESGVHVGECPRYQHELDECATHDVFTLDCMQERAVRAETERDISARLLSQATDRINDLEAERDAQAQRIRDLRTALEDVLSLGQLIKDFYAEDLDSEVAEGWLDAADAARKVIDE